MLGKTAGSLFWMLRYLERAENMARLVDAGFRISLTHSETISEEWGSVLSAAGIETLYLEHHGEINTNDVVNFLLTSPDNPSSVYSCIRAARMNGRVARTALTREMWEAVNESWISLNATFEKAITPQKLPDILSHIRRQCALVRGAMEGTMLRNDYYEFANLGKFIERTDATARLLSVKYYLLLPSVNLVGGPVDNTQWETILRSVSAERAYHYLYPGDVNASDICSFLILDRRMPRSLHFCIRGLTQSLDHLRGSYNFTPQSYEQAYDLRAKVENVTIENIFDIGLHEFLTSLSNDTATLAGQLEDDYRFSP